MSHQRNAESPSKILTKPTEEILLIPEDLLKHETKEDVQRRISVVLQADKSYSRGGLNLQHINAILTENDKCTRGIKKRKEAIHALKNLKKGGDTTPDTFFQKTKETSSMLTREPDSIRIASWNLEKMSINTWQNKKETDHIIKMINTVDFIALQEVLDEQVVKEIIEELRETGHEEWDYLCERIPSSEPGTSEHYAFLFKSNIVQCISYHWLTGHICQ